jgi:hypothetical protein
VNNASATIQTMNRRPAVTLNIIDAAEKPVVCCATPDATKITPLAIAANANQWDPWGLRYRARPNATIASPVTRLRNPARPIST